MVGMSSSVSLTLFMSYLIDRANDAKIKTYVPQSISRRACCAKIAFAAICSCFAPNHANKTCFEGTIHWLIHLHNYKRYVKPFYRFNNDDIEL